jgi:hypothetical protein
MLGVEHRVLHILGKHTTSEIHPQWVLHRFDEVCFIIEKIAGQEYEVAIVNLTGENKAHLFGFLCVLGSLEIKMLLSSRYRKGTSHVRFL